MRMSAPEYQSDNEVKFLEGMTRPVEATPSQGRGPERAAHDLQVTDRSIEAVVKHSLTKLAETSWVANWLAVGAEQFAKDMVHRANKRDGLGSR